MSQAPTFSLAQIKALGGAGRIVGASDRAFVESVLPTRTPASAPASTRTSRNKFGARRTEVDGLKFGSKIEARYYSYLVLLSRAGEVVRFHRQPEFILEGGVRYFADFLVIYADGRIEYVDVKGGEATKTQAYRDKRKQVRSRYGVDIVEVETVPSL